jgi:hydrogenase/urease accessory protein HupE
MKLFRLIFCVLSYASFISPTSAHQVDSVELEFERAEKTWVLKGMLDMAYFLPEMRGVESAPPLMRKDVMAAPKATQDRYVEQIEHTLRQLLTLKFNGKTLNWKVDFSDFKNQPLVLPEETGGWALANAVIKVDAQPGPGQLAVFWNDKLNSELILIMIEGEELDTLSVFSGMSGVLLDVAASEISSTRTETRPSKQTQVESWIVSGFRHVIPMGLDHILFILGLFLLAPRIKPLLGQSLLFTLAHSITLALVIFGVIHFPAKWVEVLIAVSIAWIGIENLFAKRINTSRLYLVFGFGLIHGMGFADVLRGKLGDLSGKALALPLVSFNIGVELAQATLLICAFIILIPFRKWTISIQNIGSVLIALVALFWIYQRIFA